MSELRPVASDPAVAIALARRAIPRRDAPAADNAQFVAQAERAVRDGNSEGVILFDDDRPVGLVFWEPRGELGVAIELIYLEPPLASLDEYRRLLTEVQARVGRILFVPSFFAGLTAPEETALMTGAGFARYARTEMSASLARDLGSPGRDDLRATQPTDLPALARLHEAAYRGTFDSYLYKVYADPIQDAELAIHEIFIGRWGEFLPGASPVLERNGEIVAACLVGRTPDGPVVLDMLVDPRHWGQGLGRALLISAMGSLRERGEPAVLLTVTDGNDRARRLYDRLGFVASRPPFVGWYSRDQVSTPPGVGPGGTVVGDGSSGA